MMNIPDQHHDADDDQHERDDHRDARNYALAIGLHLAERQHGVRESTNKNANCELAWLVLQDSLDDPWGELAHSELHDNHGDCQHKRRETDHRCRDCSQNLDSRVRPATDRLRNEVILVCLVDRNRAKRKGNAGQYTHERDEPEART